MNLREYSIKECLGCLSCQTRDEPGGCIRDDDDAGGIFRRMAGADSIILAAPLYCWSFPAPLKALLDRGVSLVRGYFDKHHRSFLEGRRAAMVVTCAGPKEQNADLVGPLFRRMCRFIKVDNVGEMVVPFCTGPENMDLKVRDEARKLARALAGGGDTDD
jgi:multimeric flavodoxin WrbA